MNISTKRLSRRMRFVMPATLAWAASAQAQAPAWLTPPAWGRQPDAVATAEGTGAIRHEPDPGNRVFDQDYLVSASAQIDRLPVTRQFYFDRRKRLVIVRIVPATLSGANCTTMLAATQAALGPAEETKSAGPSTPGYSFENSYWLRRSEDRVYRWVLFKAEAIPDDKRPCHLLIEPYETGMKRKASAK